MKRFLMSLSVAGLMLVGSNALANKECVISKDGKEVHKVSVADEAACKNAASSHCSAETQVTFDGKPVADACKVESTPAPAGK